MFNMACAVDIFLFDAVIEVGGDVAEDDKPRAPEDRKTKQSRIIILPEVASNDRNNNKPVF